MPPFEKQMIEEQRKKNELLIKNSSYLGEKIVSNAIPFKIDIDKITNLSVEQKNTLNALEIESARTAIKSLVSLAGINELDHLGGGLDLISALVLTLAVSDYEKIEYTIENAHTSIGYYSALASFGYLDQNYVIDKFRRGLDIAGHVAWVPGGTQMNGGRLGVMVPVAVGNALGKKAIYGKGSWVVTHCGDAGWISGQALNGFNAADFHNAPITFVMHRNGIQLSGATSSVMNKDPRTIIESLGVAIIEIPSIHDTSSLYKAYREAFMLAKEGRPSMIYPVGYQTTDGDKVTIQTLGMMYGIEEETKKFAAANDVPLETQICIPGALMSYRDVVPMLECVFLVNQLKGGAGHHDGHMKGRDGDEVLSNPMMTLSAEQKNLLDTLRKQPANKITFNARKAPGSKNLVLSDENIADVELPPVGKSVSPRAGTDKAYAAVAKTFPDNMFVVSCDLDASTKLSKARTFLNEQHQFEMSIEEQASALMANGLATSSTGPQLNIFSTFAAFFEGIAREGFEMWRYQRNLNGINEGLNVTFHLSHVGACTGRDHFSGWSLDWITLAIGYLPYLHRFYAPADARASFLAVKDLAAHYGGHIIGAPRDNLPILEKQDGSGPIWEKDSKWEAVTEFRKYPDAKKAILAMGAPAFLGAQASEELNKAGIPTDVYIINGLPLEKNTLTDLFKKYPDGIVTIEDGIISTSDSGLRGFAGLVCGAASGQNIPVAHVGITDPRTAPSEGHMEVWEHFGITASALVDAVKSL